MSQLTIIQDGKTTACTFDAPLLLSDALAAFGYAVPHPCGGRGACKKCTVVLDGTPVLACRTTVSEDAEVLLPDTETLIALAGEEETGRLTKQLCFCLDVGTTTLALALVSVDDARIVRSVTAPNPQRAFGADVISRIDFCMKNGPLELQRVLISRLQEMIDALLSEFSLSVVPTLVVSGNTTMLHLLFGVDCASMGVSPYTPVFLLISRFIQYSSPSI